MVVNTQIVKMCDRSEWCGPRRTLKRLQKSQWEAARSTIYSNKPTAHQYIPIPEHFACDNLMLKGHTKLNFLILKLY
jgi:hypothetical protein